MAAGKRQIRQAMTEAVVGTFYRHVCSDAAAAASVQDWTERRRLVEMAKEIERAYPGASSRARFARDPICRDY